MIGPPARPEPVRARARRHRPVALVLAAVVVAGCSGDAAPVGSGGPDRSEQAPAAEAGGTLPQGQPAPLALGGGFGRWREVFGGTFQYWRGQDLRYRFRERADRGRGGSYSADRDSAFEDWLGGDWTDKEWTHSEWVDQEWIDQEWIDQYWPDFGSVAAEVWLDVHLAPTGSAGHVDWDCGEPSGRERLELLDADGQVVHRVAASVAQPAVRVHESLGHVTYRFLYGWCAVVALRPAFDSYRIVRDRIDDDGQQRTVVLVERGASPRGPVVTIASPVRGHRFGGGRGVGGVVGVGRRRRRAHQPGVLLRGWGRDLPLGPRAAPPASRCADCGISRPRAVDGATDAGCVLGRSRRFRQHRAGPVLGCGLRRGALDGRAVTGLRGRLARPHRWRISAPARLVTVLTKRAQPTRRLG